MLMDFSFRKLINNRLKKGEELLWQTELCKTKHLITEQVRLKRSQMKQRHMISKKLLYVPIQI